MKLENILKQAGKLILIGTGIYLTYRTLKNYLEPKQFEFDFDKNRKGEEYPLFI